MGDAIFDAMFSNAAAEIVGGDTDLPANDDLPPCGEDMVARPAKGGHSDPNDAASLSVPAGSCLDEEASKRLATVRALNGNPDLAPNPSQSSEADRLTDPGVSPVPVDEEDEMDTIEVQIGTSVTQTLKALDMQNIEDDDQPRRSAFSRRFRKS
jgi:hypothetical protein